MIVPIRPGDIPRFDWIPQAELARPLSFFSEHNGLIFFKDCDDLDEFEGNIFGLGDGIVFFLRAYRNHRTDRTEIYLPHTVRSVKQITDIIHRILLELGLKQSDLTWQRSDNPEQ